MNHNQARLGAMLLEAVVSLKPRRLIKIGKRMSAKEARGKKLLLAYCFALILLLLGGPLEPLTGADGLAIQSAAAAAATDSSASPVSSPPSTPPPVAANPVSSGQSSTASPGGPQARHLHQRSSTAAARQSPASFATSLIGALGNMVPNLITNVAPLVLLFGLGALMMPALGLNAASLSRESRPSLIPTDHIAPQMQTAASWPTTFYYPNWQQTLFANAQQQHPQHQQSVRQQAGLAQDYYYLTKRSLDSTHNVNQNHASQQQQQSFTWPTSGQIASGLQTLLEHVSKAIENADKQYELASAKAPAAPASPVETMTNNNQQQQVARN